MTMTIIRGFVGILPYTAVAFVLLFIYKLIHDQLTPFDDHAEMARGNGAAALTRNGAYLGVLIAMSGSLILSDESYWKDLVMFALDGIIAVAVFTVASHVFDHVILSGVNNAMQVCQGNFAVALVEAGAYIGLGAIMSASFSGQDPSIGNGLLSAVVFSFVGLASLAVVYLVYDKLLLRSRDIDGEIRDGNVASAIDVGTLVLAMSITLAFSISGDFTGWWDDIASYLIAALVSVLAVSFGRAFATVMLSHGSPRQAYDGNVAASTTIGVLSIGLGVLAGLVTFV